MALPERYDARAHFFFANWCGPCNRVKPVWEKVKMVYLMNGIECYEYNYDDAATKELMRRMGVSTIPTLVVYKVPEENEVGDITSSKELYRGDSKEIPETAMSIVTAFSLSEDF